jgi:hypothetical protein
MKPLKFYDSVNVCFPMLSFTLSGGYRRPYSDRATALETWAESVYIEPSYTLLGVYMGYCT